jgi:hypothetical protein
MEMAQEGAGQAAAYLIHQHWHLLRVVRILLSSFARVIADWRRKKSVAMGAQEAMGSLSRVDPKTGLRRF